MQAWLVVTIIAGVCVAIFVGIWIYSKVVHMEDRE